MSKDNGGPAFPGLHPSAECHYNDPGMTLRDYFAAKAMQGIIGNEYLIKRAVEGGLNVQEMARASASEAYEMADAMLAERNK